MEELAKWWNNAADALYFGNTQECPNGTMWACLMCGQIGVKSVLQSEGGEGGCSNCQEWDKNIVLVRNNNETRGAFNDAAVKIYEAIKKTFNLPILPLPDGTISFRGYLALRNCDSYLQSIRAGLRKLMVIPPSL